jgi:uncharacterized protein (DUF488 family)
MNTVTKPSLFTIGFTQKSAERFFTALAGAGVRRVIDVRLNNVSQLAGFAKRDDLRYFLQTIDGIEYLHLPLLAPTQDLLDEYKKKRGSWSAYEDAFIGLMKERRVEQQLEPAQFDRACLLCSEHEPHHCHRRLAAEYLQDRWGIPMTIQHLR